ncbi:response regulator transcription factor [Achromobacter animicus]|uniref:response regulator transcription factor n=1 Tax=Achromobacter animicus TaxID=1389935 RepID=UPI002448BA81|nr:response regulator transcription factor [Achromobacter animicus]MDH0682743.1 response regulator transcription factor [Achromobacter animicus]
MKILVIENDILLAQLLRRSLTQNSHLVDVVADGMAGLRMAFESRYDLVLIDNDLPPIDGESVLTMLRRDSQVPVFIMSSSVLTANRIEAFEAGADDFIAKPILLSELQARVYALERRGTLASGESDGNVLRLADLEVDLLRRRVFRGNTRLELTPKEFGLLTMLMRRQGEVLSKLVLAEAVWDLKFNSNTNVVEVAIRRLRAKIDEPFGVRLLHTCRGMGYTLELRRPG